LGIYAALLLYDTANHNDSYATYVVNQTGLNTDKNLYSPIVDHNDLAHHDSTCHALNWHERQHESDVVSVKEVVSPVSYREQQLLSSSDAHMSSSHMRL